MRNILPSSSTYLLASLFASSTVLLKTKTKNKKRDMSIPLHFSAQKFLDKIIIIFSLSNTFQLSISSKDVYEFENCRNLYNCGSIQSIGYPFYGGNRLNSCGGGPEFELECLSNQQTMIQIDKFQYIVLEIDESVHKMTLARRDIFTNICTANIPLFNTTLTKFTISTRNVKKVKIFYGCKPEALRQAEIQATNMTCSVGGAGDGVFFADEFVSKVGGCEFSVVVPMVLEAYDDLMKGKISLESGLRQGFDVEYDAPVAACGACEDSGGICGSGMNNTFICFCKHQSGPLCPKHGKGHHWKLIIKIAIPIIGVLACLLICCIYMTRSNVYALFHSPRKTNDDQKLEEAIEQFGSFIPRRFSYSDVMKMTDSFKDKLGQGGHGDVYKGYLSDGLSVAVKVPKVSKGNREEFLNEVVSISSASHVNVVSLLGFCLDGEKSALIYEFMPNGSLDKYIRRESNSLMEVEDLYKIAIEVARGLAYLHGRFNKRVLHFDIKPHNILLDEDFCPKISDFGLAIFCHKKESVLPTLQARGTIGYIAPELFNKSFGTVSCKSDVYSYGMMVLEMLGARKEPPTAGISDSNEMTYFPDWIYQHVTCIDAQNQQSNDMPKEAYAIERKMLLVGMWCIQSDPLHRPSITKIIEMLEGCLECLELPPKPFLFCPSTLGKASAVTSMASKTSTYSVSL